MIESPVKFPHRRKMKLKHLHDEERYIVWLKKGTILIVPGHTLKERLMWKEKVASYPLIRKAHWSRLLNPLPPTTRARNVEVLLPRAFRNFKGKRMVIFVRPWSLSKERKRALRNSDYADTVEKYVY